jgi:rubrerythrin
MTIEEAIKTAIELEAEVRDVYRNAMKATVDPAGKRIFRVMAGEEQSHLDYLKGKLRQWKEAGTITAERLDTSIPSEEVIRAGIGELEVRGADMEKGGELRWLSKAFDVEVKTSDFYKKMVKELETEGRELFAPFVEVEEGHLALVRAELDYLSRTGYWFDFKEFDME